MNLYLDNDHYLTLTGLKNGATATYQNSATVEATLLNSAGDEIPGQTWPLALDYVADSDGVYRGQIGNEITVTEDQKITVKITATSGGLTATWKLPVFVATRSE